VNLVTRVVLAWLGVVLAVVIAFYAMIAIALGCFDCASPPSLLALLAPWLLPAGMLVIAMWISARPE
jgi:hypothetical protein